MDLAYLLMDNLFTLNIIRACHRLNSFGNTESPLLKSLTVLDSYMVENETSKCSLAEEKKKQFQLKLSIETRRFCHLSLEN